MPSHLEVWKPSGRELITLSAERVTVGKASTNLISLEHDSTVSRVHAVLENLGFAWSIRDVGSRNGTYLNGEKISAERVLHSGDELRVGNSRLVFWEADEGSVNEATVAAKPARLPPRLTRRESEVLMVLCRPLVSTTHFQSPPRFVGWLPSYLSPRQPSNSICRTCTTNSLSRRRATVGSGWPTRPSDAVLSPLPCCVTAALTKTDRRSSK
jgi:hypothetical protein